MASVQMQETDTPKSRPTAGLYPGSHVLHRAETQSARGRQGGMEIIYRCQEMICKVTHLCAAATNNINTEYRIQETAVYDARQAVPRPFHQIHFNQHLECVARDLHMSLKKAH